MDGDGTKDILSGSWPGELYLFKGLAGGTYAKGSVILGGNRQPIKVGQASAAHGVDWDGDGDVDLLVGEMSGKIYLVSNVGTATAPAYDAPEVLKAGGAPIAVGGYGNPFVADWDGDGTVDLVSGGGYAVVWFKNTGTAQKPVLAAAQTLVDAKATKGDAEKGPVQRLKICVGDYDANGTIDLLVGDFATRQTKLRDLSPAEEKAKAETMAALTALSMKAREAAGPMGETDAERQAWGKRYSELLAKEPEWQRLQGDMQKYGSAVKHEYLGRVWLYARASGSGPPPTVSK